MTYNLPCRGARKLMLAFSLLATAALAQSAPASYTITASAGQDGTISPSGSISVAAGTDEWFTVTPNAGYFISSVTGCGASMEGSFGGLGTNYSTDPINGNCTVFASFAPKLPGVAIPGAKIINAISNTADMGYAMDGRTDTIWNSLAPPQPTWIDIDLGGNYVVDTVALNPAQLPNGPSTHNIYARTENGNWFLIGTIQQYTSDGQWFWQSFPNQNTPVRYVAINTDNAGGPGSWVAWREIKVTARANQPVTYTVTASAGAGGTISPSGNISVAPGKTQTFTVTSNPGYTIASVTGCGVYRSGDFGPSSGLSYTTESINGNCTVVASFKSSTPANYTVTASAGAGGTISPSGNISVAPGTVQMFTVTPNAGYTIASVTGCGVTAGTTFGGSQRFYETDYINGNCTVTASFKAISYTVTASAGAGGTISPSGNISVAPGTAQTFTVTPNPGYTIASVTGCGVTTGATFGGSQRFYQTDSINGNCTVVVNFK